MTKLISGTVALFALATADPTHAADIPAPLDKAPVAAPVSDWNWSGCYVGGNAGWKWGRSKESDTTPPFASFATAFPTASAFPFGFPGGIANPDSINGNSWAGGGQVGCRYQTPQHFVVGIEGDLGVTNLRGTQVLTTANTDTLTPFTPGDAFSMRARWESSIRGTAGYSWDRWLAYVTGGVAFTRLNADATYLANATAAVTFQPASGSSALTLTGLTIGAGVAYAIDRHWNIGVEYRYTNYGSKNIALGTISSPCLTAATCVSVAVTGNVDLQTHEVLAKLNYGFDWLPADRDDKAWGRAEESAPVSRVYGGVDYVLWWVKGAPLSVPLVSTGPVATTHHGLLGPPAENGTDSTILYGAPHALAKGGNDTQNFAGFSGSRLTWGDWIDDAQRYAVEGSGFVLEKRVAGYAARAGSDGNPILGIPVYNTVPYLVGTQTIFAGEDSLPFSLADDPNRARANGIIVGGIDISNSLQLWGSDVTGVINLHRDSSWELSGLVGFRYLNLSESFNLAVDIEGVSGPYAGEIGVARDRFDTKNQFYGAKLGMRGRAFWGPLSVDLTGSVAVGTSHEVIAISGGFNAINYTASAGSEGVFAQPSHV